MSEASPDLSTVLPGTEILEVGLSAMLTRISWPEEIPPERATRIVLTKSAWRHFVAVLAAALRDGSKPRANFHSLHRVDAHQAMRQIGLELVEYGFSQADRHAARDDTDFRPDRITLTAQLVHKRGQLIDTCGIGAEKRIVIDGQKIYRVEPNRSELRQISTYRNPEFGLQVLASNRTGGRPASSSHARMSVRHHDNRGCRTSVDTCNRRALVEICL